MEVQEQKPYVRPLRNAPSSQRGHNRTSVDILDKEAHALAIRAAKALLLKKGGDEDKFLKAWRVRDKRKQAINDLAREDAERKSSDEWNKYRCERADRYPGRHRPASLREDWGHESLDLYEGLRRGESTLLLELRTEKIALNGPLHDMRIRCPVLPSSEAGDLAEQQVTISAACTCGHRKQTVYHMFFHCPELDTARQKLVNRIGRLDWNSLLTDHAKLATQRPMVYFPLDSQYDYIREDSPFYDRYNSA
ncbi:zinc knuckle [Fusarium sporotrichioides]|uniref:Zinc knuckle n=1 Tax=Fusarium sporotrichioides TaxID=5514 RepID=A0A395RCF3_FUSSP|nr:zinc knuckle [Fusarium sporotrichioides]